MVLAMSNVGCFAGSARRHMSMRLASAGGRHGGGGGRRRRMPAASTICGPLRPAQGALLVSMLTSSIPNANRSPACARPPVSGVAHWTRASAYHCAKSLQCKALPGI